MSMLIESLERRVFLSVSVTGAALAADANAVVAATTATTAALNDLQRSGVALLKSVSAAVKQAETKADKAADAKLLAALSKASGPAFGKIKSAANGVVSTARSGALSGGAAGKALLAKPTNTALQAKVNKVITALTTTLLSRLSAVELAQGNAGVAMNTALTNITNALPSIAGAVQTAVDASAAKSGVFDTAILNVQATAAQLAADLGGPAVTPSVTLTDAVLFRGDSAGQNQDPAGSAIAYGAWSSRLDVQNVPGNYGAELFISTVANPTPSEFLSPGALAQSLSSGANTFYFWGDGDDTRGGSATFGLNLFLNGAAPGSPTISGYTIPGTGQTLNADSAPVTAGATFVVTPGAGTLSAAVSSTGTVTLTSFQVLGVGGQGSTVDIVNSTNTSAFTPPPHADGIFDTYGTFTLTVAP